MSCPEKVKVDGVDWIAAVVKLWTRLLNNTTMSRSHMLRVWF